MSRIILQMAVPDMGITANSSSLMSVVKPAINWEFEFILNWYRLTGYSDCRNEWFNRDWPRCGGEVRR
ncbi:MAG: hypothetical protein Ct9H90mP24_5680 [Methanobacteriota archaeon]|nr:MAG: hypothetical protein Ct9H90mP24_5680 [Euryarchaeota archaeon]